jgi:KaiC/GvpD/RAD55 family RecA-like ATPase
LTAIDRLVAKLNELADGTALALRVGLASYLDSLRGILEGYAHKSNAECIYVTATIPAASIMGALDVLEIKTEHVHFVDCVSHTMLGSVGAKKEDILLVESPTMLENVMLKVEYLSRKIGSKKKIVLFDSLNSLCIHNDVKIVSEFLHILVNNMRAKNITTILLTIEEHGTDDIKNMLNLVCDETMILDTTATS